MKYRTIVVDPPWEYRQKFGGPLGQYSKNRGPKPKGAAPLYGFMTQAELLALPLGEWADEKAHLYLWVTNSFMVDGHELAKAWGFEQKTILTWVKQRIGMGFYYRNTTEHVLFCVRGALPTQLHNTPTHFNAPRRGHSEKPAAFYDMVETMSPGPYLDVFARRQRFNWDTWGNECFIPEGLAL
jgi:N6-adenosine-specific RNA methylase IME4